MKNEYIDICLDEFCNKNIQTPFQNKRLSNSYFDVLYNLLQITYDRQRSSHLSTTSTSPILPPDLKTRIQFCSNNPPIQLGAAQIRDGTQRIFPPYILDKRKSTGSFSKAI